MVDLAGYDHCNIITWILNAYSHPRSKETKQTIRRCMIVYNITIKIEPSIEKDWIDWQKKEHIPDVMATGLFTGFKFFRLLEADETEGITYVVQYFSSSLHSTNGFM